MKQDCENLRVHIATASKPAIYCKKWENTGITWGDFVKMSTGENAAARTSETLAEFMADKKKQTAIKDVGGFFPGYLAEGIRDTGHVKYYSLLGLDVDHGDKPINEIIDEIKKALPGAAFLVYTTHKHTPEKPRFRLVLPFACAVVTNTQYKAIERAVTRKIGGAYFDKSEGDPARLFFWPSVSKDGVFFSCEQKGAPLNPFEYQETESSEKETDITPEIVRQEVKHAEDPTGKKGYIGAFCRVYDIEQAIIKFLPDVYEKAGPNRYTYKAGTTAGGVVLYENKFAFSHHESDPAHGLNNAFDLVRLHLFGHLDKGGNLSKKPQDLASFQEMERLCDYDDATRNEFAKAAAQELKERESDLDIMQRYFQCEGETLAEVYERIIKEKKVTTNKAGKIENTYPNIEAVFDNDPNLRGRFWTDDLTGAIWSEGVAWKKKADIWTDKDDSNLRCYLGFLGIEGKEKINDILNKKFDATHRHPVREYLGGLQWDGVPRLERVFIDYLGAPDTELVRAQTKTELCAAVARIFEPGVKFDNCIVLQGGQGIGKSTVLRVLASSDWFTDTVLSIEGKEGAEAIRGKWIVELGELAGIRKSDVEKVKNYISTQCDTYRPAYGKRTETHARQCVFFGTTNESEFLRGTDGNRRFWVIPCNANPETTPARLDRLKLERGQIWAEAVHNYNTGVNLYLPYHLQAESDEMQKAYNIDEIDKDETRGELLEYLEQRLPPDWYSWDKMRRRAFVQNPDPLAAESMGRVKFCPSEYVFEKMRQGMTQAEHRNAIKLINKIMKDHAEEWRKKLVRIPGYGVQKGFEKRNAQSL